MLEGKKTCKLIKPRKQVEMIRQLTTPETGIKGCHTLIPRVLSLPIETTSQTPGSRIQTNKEISPLLTKCGEIPHKNAL